MSAASVRLRTFLLSSAALTALAWAPQAAAQAADTDGLAEVEEVLVTGTLIAGVAPVGSSLSVLGAEQIQKYPSTNVVELLNREPAFSGLGNNQAVKTSVGPGAGQVNLGRGSDINLRGIGPSATLVLFDGARIPSTGATAGQHDVSIIPTLVLQRVEVVPDGASATYGSDAVAGVVNFIPRKTFDGAELRLLRAHADGFDKTQVSGMIGQQWDRGGWVLAGEHTVHTNLAGYERDWFRSDLRSEGGTDYRSTLCNPGNLIVGGVTYAIPAGGVTPATANQLIPNTRNRCENTRLGDIIPRQQMENLYAHLTYDLTDNVTFGAHGLYSRRLYRISDISVGSQNLQSTVAVPATNAFFVRPPGTTAAVSVERLFNDNSLLQVKGFVRWQTYGANFQWKMPYEWQSTVDYDYARIESELLTYGPFAAAIAADLASSNPATALNVFGSGRNGPALISDIFRQYYDPTGRYITHQFRANANGPLFTLPGGPVRMALGVERYDTRAKLINHFGDANTVSTRPPSRSILKRRVDSLYAEAFVPLVGDDNALPLVRRLELSLAVRQDDYSDLGKTTNPKYGVNWTPVDGLKLHASYGTSFVAPSVANTISPSIGATISYNTAPDPQSPTGVSNGVSYVDSNPNVSPESAETWSFGADWKPSQIPGLSLSATFYSIDYRDKLTVVTPAQSLANPLLSRFVVRNPSQAQIDALLATGLRISGVRPPVIQFIHDQRPQNLGGLKAEGIDFTAAYAFETGYGSFDVGMVGTYATKFTVAAIKGAPYVDQLNTIYNPLKFRTRGYVEWSKDAFGAEIAVNYTNGYRNNNVTPVQHVSAYATFDARLSFEPEWTGQLEGFSASLQVQNIFDKDPPFVNVDGGADLTVASPFGRMMSLTLTKKW